MAGVRSVITTLTANGEEIMGPDSLIWHYPDPSIISGSLLTVESNHFCVLKSRGAILSVYETGQYPLQTPDRPLFGRLVQDYYGGQSPWQYEVLYINRAKLVLRRMAWHFHARWRRWSTAWTTISMSRREKMPFSSCSICLIV